MSEGPVERARLFVALDLDQSVRVALAAWRDEVVVAAGAGAGLRAVPEEGFHVTLCFLGWRSLLEVEAIGDACAASVVGVSAGGLALGGALWLPRRRPRVLAVAVDDADGDLARVQGAVSRALAAGGWYRPEARPFLGHVSVARVKPAAPARLAGGVPAVPPPPALALGPGASVTLYRSHLSPRGARYEALRTAPAGVGVD